MKNQRCYHGSLCCSYDFSYLFIETHFILFRASILNFHHLSDILGVAAKFSAHLTLKRFIIGVVSSPYNFSIQNHSQNPDRVQIRLESSDRPYSQLTSFLFSKTLLSEFLCFLSV